MSMESLSRFLNQVRDDKGLRDEYHRLLERGEAGCDAIAAMGAHQGFDFTADEFLEAARWAHGQRELSDEELATVSGGTGPVVRPTSPTPTVRAGFEDPLTAFENPIIAFENPIIAHGP